VAKAQKEGSFPKDLVDGADPKLYLIEKISCMDHNNFYKVKFFRRVV
jgi:hypothetical protein